MSDSDGSRTDDRGAPHAEREAMRARLVEIDALVSTGRLAASVAHEIRGPLQAVLTHLALVERALPRDFPERESWDLAVAGLERIREIVGEFLGVHRTSATPPSRVDCNALVRAVAGLVEGHARALGVRLTLELDDDPPIVAGSFGRLFQIVLNLVLNAVEAMPQGGVALLVAESRDDRAFLEVRDRGRGIPPERIETIFEPFESSGKSAGTGLGLYVARRLAEEHGGAIEVASRLGVGTTFRVVLPRVKDDTSR